MVAEEIRLLLDATDAAHPDPTGIGIYSRKLIAALARRMTTEEASAFRLVLSLRPKAYLRWLRMHNWPAPSRVQLLLDPWLQYPHADLFHGMSQRLPKFSYPTQVFTLHDRYPLVSEDYASPEFRRLLTDRIEDGIRRADRIIAVSEAVRQRLLLYDASLGSKSRVVRHGVDPPQLATPEEITTFRSRELGFSPQERFFLNVGAIQVRKNISNMALALKQMPRYRLVLAGADGYGADKIRALIRKEGLTDRILVMGRVPLAVLRLLYCSASAFLFPSLEEGFGLPILEAMSYGLPVITSDVPATKEVAGDAAILVNPHSVSEICDAMRRVMEYPDTACALAQRGQQRVSQFSWEKCAEQTLAVYQEALSGGR